MQKMDISEAIAALRHGNLVVYPTDTLYGLAADIFNEDAVRKVFDIKKRPLDMPLPVAVSTVDEIKTIAVVSDNARRLAERFLPGPLTLILQKRSCVPAVVTGERDNIAVRIPDHTIALTLLSQCGPLTVTSANVHGTETSPIIKEIKMQFNTNDIAAYIDAGRLDGLPSTIVDVTTECPKILREGLISKQAILDEI